MVARSTTSRSWYTNMPRSTREWAKRKLKEAQNQLDWAATHLVAVHTVYEEDHPEIATPISLIVDTLKLLHEEITTIDKGF